MREHEPIIFDRFNGLWDRGDIEEVSLDHFSESKNIQFLGSNSFGTRFGISRFQQIPLPLSSILRIYNYPTQTNNTLLVLTSAGTIYHVVDSTTMYGPILTLNGMTDFGFVPYAGRAYITPFTTSVVGDLNTELGLPLDYVYVYKGDGTLAHIAGGLAPTTNIVVANGTAATMDAGTKIFGYVYETDTGYLTAPGGLVSFNVNAASSVSFTNVANSVEIGVVVKKHIVASKSITSYNGDVNGYQLFFIPGATIPNNTTTTLSNVQFFDADLLSDASHLSDNFARISAGVGLCVYHNRLCLFGQYSDISLVRVSFPGEPEAISQIDGLLLIPPDGNPLTNAAEFRDILYIMKRNRTVAFADNGDVPSSWPLSIIDNAMGCGVHGIATVLDSGSSNVDFLIIGSYKGISLFNGRYILPELSWKIQNLWINQDFAHSFRNIQIINDSVQQKLYIINTDKQILFGNYANGLDPKSIRWCPWEFQFNINSLALINVNELIMGCDQI